MNKYFLPVYHSELKPWIKWWILKRLNGGESTLKAVTISSGTLTKVDKSKALSITEYYGNTVQNGTPTPESPVEIKTISGNITFNINSVNYNLDLKSKNLYKYTTKTEDGWYTDIPNFINDTGTYTFSINNTSLTGNWAVYFINSSKQRVGDFIKPTSDVATPSTFTVTTEQTNAPYIRILPNASGLHDIENYNIMVNEGTTALPYESYYNYELCKIGDFKDKIVNVNGTWKVEKKVGKTIYNGTENWYFTSNCCYINNIVDTVKRPPNNNTKANILCDHYQIDTLANCYNNVTDKRISVNNGGYVYIYDTSFTSANDIKTWLTTHNTDLYYVLATTTTETITNTNLISQLNALYEFYVNSSKVTISNDSEIPLEVLLEYYGR